MTKYTARGPIPAPGTMVFGYRRGDEVHQSVVESWELNVGPDGDVVEGDLDETAESSGMARPGPADTRATWETWAVSHGMSEEDAAEASQETLEAFDPDDERPEPKGAPQRPSDSAKKAEWVAYVVGRAGDDESTAEWAQADTTTKADLQGWQPGDAVALAATEANQAG